MSVAVKRLLLDSLKPRELSIIELSKALGSVEGVEGVDIVVIEVDSKTETIKVTIKGPQIDHNAVQKVMEKHGVSIKGVDEISVTKT
ncbi:MAG: DUF211 domain-containing protein [Candidatus Bathyarchaeota archaeon]|nr:DUF211 domain-containing protein [Candidatus Bathyarchaeota archaeon]